MCIKEDQKMFIVSEDVVKEIRYALKAYIEVISEECLYWGCMCASKGEVCSHKISVILHNFESSLRIPLGMNKETGCKQV
jgi:hypothetical protein